MPASASSGHKYLAIVCAGNDSLHEKGGWHHWPRNFDLCVIYFGDDSEIAKRYEAGCDFFFRHKGPKWRILHKVSMWLLASLVDDLFIVPYFLFCGVVANGLTGTG